MFILQVIFKILFYHWFIFFLVSLFSTLLQQNLSEVEREKHILPTE